MIEELTSRNLRIIFQIYLSKRRTKSKKEGRFIFVLLNNRNNILILLITFVNTQNMTQRFI